MSSGHTDGCKFLAEATRGFLAAVPIPAPAGPTPRGTCDATEQHAGFPDIPDLSGSPVAF